MTKNYLLVMEYANGGSLRNYLKNNFEYLSWKDKYKLAYQLACAVSCLHNEGIVHRDLVIYLFLLIIVKICLLIYLFNSIFNSILVMF